MRKYLNICCALALLWLAGCNKIEKDIDKHGPKVRTVSAVVLADGKVEVTGEIISKGNYELAYVGFCMDTIPVSSIHTNQKLAAIEGNTFKYTYENLDALTKYYFRAWATNEKAYAAGDNIAVEGVSGGGASPCNPAAEMLTVLTPSLRDDSEPVYSTEMSNAGVNWDAEIVAGSYKVVLTFGRDKPVSGKYTTTAASSGSDTKVSAQLSISGWIYDIAAGYTVYVKQIDALHTQVTFCDLEVPSAGSKYVISLNAVCNIK